MLLTNSGSHGVSTSPKKYLMLPMLINEKRSKTTRSRFPASISLPDKTVELQRSRGELRRERLSHREKGCCVRWRKKYLVTYRCVWVSVFDVPSTPVCLQKRSLPHQAVIHTVCSTSHVRDQEVQDILAFKLECADWQDWSYRCVRRQPVD